MSELKCSDTSCDKPTTLLIGRRNTNQNHRLGFGPSITIIQAYVVTDKTNRILIPSCGNSYEAEYLLEQGFTNTVIDIAPTSVAVLKKNSKII
jgi:hypothetical protein